MNSNHSTLCFKYEENKMECNTGKKQSQRRRNIDCNVNSVGISDNPLAFNFVIQKIYVFKNIQQQDGFQPPLHKINAIIYIK